MKEGKNAREKTGSLEKNIGINECVFVTWNIQGMSVRENNRA